jgi:hypothetical protein
MSWSDQNTDEIDHMRRDCVSQTSYIDSAVIRRRLLNQCFCKVEYYSAGYSFGECLDRERDYKKCVDNIYTPKCDVLSAIL